MNLTRISLVSSIAAVLAWAAKAVAIGTAGGLGRSPWEGPLFLAGLACFLTAVVTFALAVTERRGALARTGAAVASVVGGFALAMAVNAVVQAVSSGQSWVREEVNLWVAATAMLGLASWWAASRQDRVEAG